MCVSFRADQDPLEAAGEKGGFDSSNNIDSDSTRTGRYDPRYYETTRAPDSKENDYYTTSGSVSYESRSRTYQSGSYDQSGNYNPSGGYDQTGTYRQTEYDRSGGTVQSGSYDQSRGQSGAYDDSGRQSGTYDQSGRQSGGYDQSGRQSGVYDQSERQSGAYDQSGRQSGGYDQTGRQTEEYDRQSGSYGISGSFQVNQSEASGSYGSSGSAYSGSRSESSPYENRRPYSSSYDIFEAPASAYGPKNGSERCIPKCFAEKGDRVNSTLLRKKTGFLTLKFCRVSLAYRVYLERKVNKVSQVKKESWEARATKVNLVPWDQEAL